jgi:hypothetical protein
MVVAPLTRDMAPPKRLVKEAPAAVSMGSGAASDTGWREVVTAGMLAGSVDTGVIVTLSISSLLEDNEGARVLRPLRV